ncbi:zinc finger protein 37 homolog [Bicyclus anynana]|uniref:Zinc finger protein 37 homolog n=1 Tax=Bicyclus anynana TaxID=110368 RepID=A0ABM3M5R0_BICAN|nr:zinc finger protein 37 homolog [Bicyclus anynana]
MEAMEIQNELQNDECVSSAVEFCMICLDTECKLYKLDKYNLHTNFKNLTGIELQEEVRFVPQLCTECAQRLTNCAKFRDKSLRAYHLLAQLGERSEMLTLEQIKTINRTHNQLASNITKITFEPDSYDVCVKEHQEHIVQKIEIKIEKDTDIDHQNLNHNIKFEKNLSHDELDDDTPEFEIDVINKTEFNDEDMDYDMDVLDDCDTYVDFAKSKSDMNSSRSNVIKNKNIAKTNKASLNNSTLVVNRNKNNIKDENDKNKMILKKEQKNIPKIKNLNRIVKKALNKNAGSTKTLRNAVKDRTQSIKSKKQNCNKKITIKKDLAGGDNLKEVRPKRKRVKGGKPGKPPSKDHLKMFEVTERSKEEQLEEIQKRKETSSYKSSLYKCTVCYKGFIDIKAYDGHMDRHSDKFGKFECSICGIRTKNKICLRKHTLMNHLFRYNCLKCSFVTNHRNTALNHERWHDGKQYKCPHCGEVFTKYTSRMSHVRLKHPSDHVCRLCGFSFIGERGLSLHMSKTHRAAETESLDGPQCEECNIRFASSAAYEQHMKVSPKHAPADKLKANTPVKKYPYKKLPLKRIDCELCGMQLVGVRNYARHFRMLHPGKTRTKYSSVNVMKMGVMCELCGKVMPSLRFHLPCHAQQKQFKCDVCDERFETKHFLNKHAETHSGGSRPRHECNICGKNMSYASNLWRHMLSHKDTRPYYKCDICDKNFAAAQGRDNHVLHVHNNVPRPKRVRAPRAGTKLSQTRIKGELGTSDSEES